MQNGNGENEPATEPEEAKETAAAEAASSESPPRGTLAERLMSLDPAGAPSARRAPNPTPRRADAPAPPVLERPSAPPPERRVWNTGGGRLTSGIVDDTLQEARRYIRVRYLVFLASILVVFLVAVVVGIIFIASLLSGSDWEEPATSGAVTGVALFLLILLQYRPARSFALAASQLAQLEATQTNLDRSFGFWERYLSERQASHQLTANDVAVAVSSLTAASRDLMTAEMTLEAGFAKAFGAAGAGRAPGSGMPTSTTPDPGRF